MYPLPCPFGAISGLSRVPSIHSHSRSCKLHSVVYNFLYFNRFSKVCQSFLKIYCKPPENLRFLITQGEVIGHEVASIEQNLVQELICRFLDLITHGLVFRLKINGFTCCKCTIDFIDARMSPGHCRFLVIVQITNMVSIVRIC